MGKYTPFGHIYDDITPYTWRQRRDYLESELEEGQCPECLSENTFETPKAKYHNYVCRECWNKY